LAKSADARVCILLLDVDSASVPPPLSQFQHTASTREGMWKLLRDINSAVFQCGERAISDDVLDEAFDTWWPKLEGKLHAIPASVETDSKRRSDRELLEELLVIARGMQRTSVPENFRSEVYRHDDPNFRSYTISWPVNSGLTR